MYRISQKFRATYEGEDVVTLLEFTGGESTSTTEYVANNVFNNYLTTQAVVIGNGDSAKFKDGKLLEKIKSHRGGILASNKLQTYGTNETWRNIECDFLVAISDENVKPIVDNGYCNTNIVYTNADMVLKYPGKLYLIPQDPPWNSGAIAAYLAAFDGHSKVFLLGMETNSKERPFWIKSAKMVFETYPETDFVYITEGPDGDFPKEWEALDNVRHIGVWDFIKEADIG
jgi:hypothetical protein